MTAGLCAPELLADQVARRVTTPLKVLALNKQFFWIIFQQSWGAAIAIHSCCQRGHQGVKSSPQSPQ
ncbi:hypothetical protein IHE44_0004565, partial [Lamprotornis superbus]